MIKSFKYRIYPNKTQEKMFEEHFNSNRFIWNWALSKKIEVYQQNKTNLSRFQLSALMTKAKKEEFPWLYHTANQTLQATLRHLEEAYTRFYRKQNKFPNFKSKKRYKKSCEFTQSKLFRIDLETSKLHLTKLGDIKIVLDRTYKGVIKSINITKSNTDKYYAILNCDIPSIKVHKPEIKRETSIGIDLGISSLVVTSNGLKIDNPKYLDKQLTKLQHMQRKLSKKVYGSNNWKKYNFNITKLYEKISNQRKDFLHKLSYKLTHDNQVDTIVMETLDIQHMQKNKSLARKIADASWNMLTTFVKYKCEWYNKNFLQIGQYEPSSKLCNVCGNINNELKLSDRTWTCKACSTLHDRDENASNNIVDIGINKLNLIARPDWSNVAC